MPQHPPPPRPPRPPLVRSAVAGFERAVLDALAVVLPVSCAGCGEPDRAVCDECRVALAAAPKLVERPGLSAWAALEYAGPVASAIGEFKDGGRTDAAPALALALRAAIARAVAAAPPGRALEVCTIPSAPGAYRARGYAPVEVLLARCGIRSSKVLALARGRVDQAGLGAEARRANSAGGLVAVRPLAGRRFLLVDDVLTTGSTLAEAARAIIAAGGSTGAFAVLAETPLRHGGHAAKSPETLRDFA